MSPGPDSPPGPEPSPGSSPPSPGGEPGPNPPSGPQSDGPEAPADEAPRRSRSARRRARRRAARRARDQDAPTAGTGTSSPSDDAAGTPDTAESAAAESAAAESAAAAPEAIPRPGRGAARGTARTGRGSHNSNRAQNSNRGQGATRGQGSNQARGSTQAQRGRGPKRLDSPPDPETRNRARRGRLRQVEEFSAGGLVLDLNGEVPRGALIGRTDRQGRLLWSLPKGHIEAGETAEQAAVREVEEETGIAGTILGELGTIDFWFVADGRRIHKTVRHYLMRRIAGELSDADVEVDEVAWVPFSEIRGQLAYPDERGLVDTAGRMLADSA